MSRMNLSALARGGTVALLLAGTACSDGSGPQALSGPAAPSITIPGDVDRRIEFRTGSGHRRILQSQERGLAGGKRSIVMSLDGRPFMELQEQWEVLGGAWAVTGRSVRPLSSEGRGAWRDVAASTGDAAMTPGLSLVSSTAPCDSLGGEVAYSGDSCMKQALVFVGAGLVAEAAVAAAVANPLLIGAAYTAITAVAVAYADYIACLQQPK